VSVDTAAGVSGRCPACGEPAAAADSFCEACGKELAPVLISDGGQAAASSCSFCGSPAVTAEGYCESCGRKLPAGRDHVELDAGPVAGVTDRGVRHHRNEDAMALAATVTPDGAAVVAVVCDGVSTSARPDEASLAGVRAAARSLLAAVRAGEDPLTASPAAARAAADAVAGLAGPPGDPPAATFVSAVVTPAAVTVCWLGDSRAYWLAEAGSQQLTTDDAILGHVVTRWLGADSRDAEPHVLRFEPPGPGALLLCSDGLWNYLPDPAALAQRALPALTASQAPPALTANQAPPALTASQAPPGALTGPLAAARELASFAIDAGGADNVTVVLAPFPLQA
jgi:serine/threonine protein phosphatase PrpC